MRIVPFCSSVLSRFTATALVLTAVLGTAQANITDDFARADSATVGNGWIEKNPSAFSLADGRVTKQSVSTGYNDNLVYRPAAEDVLDVEASVELRFTASNPGYPQVHTRVQSSSVTWAYWLDSYMLYVSESNTQAILGRQRGTAFVTTLATINLSPALNTTDTFRLRLRSTGTSPVVLTAFVERLNGANWQIIGQASYDDSSSERLVTAGSVGFSGYDETAYSLDNFVRTNLDGEPSNPEPTTASLSPAVALAGESGLTMTVQGADFVENSQVRWNGSPRTTTFISATELEAAITAADLASAGAASVTVFNPAPGGGTSNAQAFTINPNGGSNPAPVAASLSPATTAAGGSAFVLTVNGSNFATNATVRWNGAARATTFVSANQLQASIGAADIAAAGSATVTVFNPAPGGGTSTGVAFTISAAQNPAPTLSSLSPSSRTADTGAFTLTVSGANFVSGSVVRWNGNNRSTTFVSSTSLTAAIGASDVASAGSASITVFTPTPGGGTSTASTFTINPSGGGGGTLALAELTPVSTIIGASSALVTVTGSGFTASSVARWNGQNRSTSYVSPTELQVTLTAADLDDDAIGTITVANGTTSSGPLSFYVLPSTETVFFDGFNRGASANIGNGWVEKTPDAFSISATGTVSAGNTFPLDFHDAIVYRQNGEDFLNVETSVEFVRQPHGEGFAQLHSRIQRDTVQQFDTLNSYILYVEDYLPSPGALAFAIQPAVYNVGECVLRFIPLPSPLENGTRYRLRFQVEGAYPVQLTGTLERYNGSAWEVFVSGSMTHDATTEDAGYFCPFPSVPAPISTAGSVGFAKWETVSEVYDNFHYRTLNSGAPVSNVPAVTSITPSATTAGSGAFNLIVNGANFSTNSTVRWNGADRTTTFISSTQLQAAITAGDVQSAGTANVTVFNTGGDVSPQTEQFTIVAGGGGGTFTDSFSRSDSPTIGNGWIEKTPSAFSLAGGRIVKQASTVDYRDTLLYRPAAEALLDAEVSTVLSMNSTAIGYPALFARLQSATVGNYDTADGYMLYFDDSATSVILGRQRGNQFVTTLSSFTLSTPLNTADLFRMRLRTTGTSPVQVQAVVERLVSGSWVIVGQTTVNDSSPDRITTPGVGGLGGWIEATYAYDDFSVTNLDGESNPAPTTASLSPAVALAGESGLTMTVQGADFVENSQVRWNGSPRTTTFISATELEAAITAADLASAGAASVTVFNPAPGGGTSNAQAFTINPNGGSNPAPVAASLSPATTAAGGSAFVLTVNGSNFATNATVRWNGAARATTFVSANQLQASIGAADIAAAGSATVTVFNPAPGGGTSTGVAFTISAAQNPAPTLSSLSPSSRTADTGAFTLTVSGANFVSGSVVRWNGNNRSTTFVSSTSLTAAIGASDVASAGSASITVFTPTPGGGTSTASTFTINPSGGGGGTLALAELTPVSTIIGASSALVTVTGSGFTASSVARWNGQNRSTSYVSPTELQVTLTAADLDDDAIGTITVANGTTSSGPLSFYVLPSTETVFFDGFNRGASANIGNGWVEKTPDAFSISATGTVSAGNTFPLDFHDAIVYRQNGEDFLNVETSVEFVRQPHGEGFAQLHSRIQRDTVQQFDTLNSYILYVEDYLPSPGALAFAIQPAVYNVGECVLRFIPLPSPLENGTRYRLRFQVEGAYPVQLTGTLERYNGSAWEVFVSGSMTHDATTEDAGYFCPFPSVPAPISTAGSVGFAKWETVSEVYDNFHYRTLNSGAPVSNVPAVTSITPSATTAGSGAFNLIVNGANFSTNSTVRWNGADRTTTFISSTQLQAAITAGDVQSAGTANVTVFNTGGDVSPQTEQFTIVAGGGGGTFTDSFSRSDSPTIGNGWIEKTPSAFSLAGGRIVKQASTVDYRDTLLYRPAAEALLDAEVSTVLSMNSTAIGYPALFARLQSATVGNYDTADGYMLYFDDSATSVILGRQRGNQFVTTLSSFTLSTPLNTADLFRMRLRTTGTSPVQVQAVVERLVSGSWVIVGQTTVNDSSPDRITTPGVGGLGGWIETTYAYDDFSVTNLAP